MAAPRRAGLPTLTTRLIRENHTGCVEALAVKNRVRSHTLAHALSDAGWGEWGRGGASGGEWGRHRADKAEWCGRTRVKIDRWFPSSNRGQVGGPMLDSRPLDVRQWTCPACGVRHGTTGTALPHRPFLPWDAR